MNSSLSGAPAQSVDAARFLRAWLVRPLATGAQLPSGRDLSRAMAAAVDPEAPGVVVELGPGTGPVTEALLQRGVAPERLILVESNPHFCTLLGARYPHVRILSGDAFAAPRMLRQSGVGPVAAIVSSLPLAVFRPWRRRRLLLEWLSLGTPETPFVQFTYFPIPPIPVGEGRIVRGAAPRVWNNLWPARVWTYRDAAASAA